MNNKFYYKDGTISNKRLPSTPISTTPLLHRLDGPAIKTSTGEDWYVDGKRHRVDGPAADYTNGDKYWLMYGNLHRVDGPAIEYSNGSKEWWLDGDEYTKEEFDKLIKEAKALPLALRLIDPREWIRRMV